MHNSKAKRVHFKKLFTFQILCCSDYGNNNYEQEKQFKRNPGVAADE